MTLPGKLEMFEDWKTDALAQGEFFQRLAEGETPKEICKQQRLPYSMFMDYVKANPELKARYASALETWVESLAHETVAIADGVAGETEGASVSAAKLRVETRFKLASKLYREMFGEDMKPAVAVNISLGDVAREIRELEERLGIGMKVSEALPVVVEGEAVRG
jgi:hypothetical protein